ncbi:MAG TPA: hypothetical protein EYO94_12605 [Acidobacteria bacterium]|nr:hypothetical protein [Acidobacteriota bacterium]
MSGLLVLLAATTIRVQTQELTSEHQISSATLPAPADRRAAATVLGYDDMGTLTTLRSGFNEFVCLADNPADHAFSVACYHEDLEPFMARGRQLLAQGITGMTRIQTREREVASGTLTMPREPRTLYVIEGSGFDADSGVITDAYTRWVVYTPFATPESSGLSTEPSEGGPWLMMPGMAGAHIMITPPRP